YTSEVKAVVSSWSSGPWCRIIDMYDFNLTIPEAESHLNEFIRWCDAADCVGHLYVSKSLLHKKHLEDVVPPEDGPLIFESLDDALVDARRRLMVRGS
ncbi:MAG: hypothetical protein RQ801_14490, partial [Spirochaetaceae bacterium]|nr:hypothetical protein [Spirochaetaceae bacterium]